MTLISHLSPWVTRWKISRLSRHPSVAAQAIAEAFKNTVSGQAPSADERRLIDRIEALRETLNASSQRLLMYYEGGSGQERIVGDICRKAAQPPREALLLFRLARALRPRMCLEMGTNLGISTAYQTAALQLNQRGALVTVEGAPPLAKLADEHFRSLGLTRVTIAVGRFAKILPAVLQAHGPFDYAFIDGHHDEVATLTYLEQILPHLSAPALLVFDDVNWSAGMERAWQQIAADRRLPVTVRLSKIGIAVADSPSLPQLRLRMFLWAA